MRTLINTPGLHEIKEVPTLIWKGELVKVGNKIKLQNYYYPAGLNKLPEIVTWEAKIVKILRGYNRPDMFQVNNLPHKWTTFQKWNIVELINQ